MADDGGDEENESKKYNLEDQLDTDEEEKTEEGGFREHGTEEERYLESSEEEINRLADEVIINVDDLDVSTDTSTDTSTSGVSSLRALTVAEASRLTPERCQILKETFLAVKNTGYIHNIQTLFIRLFSEYPQYKNIWPQFRDIPDSSLMFSNELRKHVNVYGKGMNQIINALHSEKELYVILRKLAKAHAKKAVFKAHVMNMLPEYLAVLKEANVEVNEGVRDAWTTLFDVIGNLVDPLKGEALKH